MSLSHKQHNFTNALGKLICYAYSCGYKLTLGDTYPGKYPHKQGSFHDKGLAIDLNLFKGNKYLTKTEDHTFLGEYWEKLGGTWGGRFKNPDGNHYSWGER